MKHQPARQAQAAPALVGHSSRRSAAAQPSIRRQQSPRPAPVTVYRRPNPLHVDSRDDRQALRLLLLPFVLFALVLAIVPSLHVFPTLRDLIAATPQISAPAVTSIAEIRAAPAPHVVAGVSPPSLPGQPPATAVRAPHAEFDTAHQSTVAPQAAAALAPALAYAVRSTPSHFDAQRSPPASQLAWSNATEPATQVAGTGLAAPAVPPRQAALTRVTPDYVRSADVALPTLPDRSQTVAMLTPPRLPALLSPLPPAPYETSCPVSYGSAAPNDESTVALSGDASFGARLAAAAVTQLKQFVIYDDKYRQIARAGGDVPSLYGVCTDVVIRAYRSVGVDLQVLVQASKLGAGDPNIDHRRTETLRRYLARYGQSLPVTPFGEDYQPGDIVTYWRPQNSGSRSHIALVAATRGPSGKPMIIHNRGWGPQMEDGLFVDRITGHYRYDGSARPPVPPQLATTPARPFAVSSPALPVALGANEANSATKPGRF